MARHIGPPRGPAPARHAVLALAVLSAGWSSLAQAQPPSTAAPSPAPSSPAPSRAALSRPEVEIFFKDGTQTTGTLLAQDDDSVTLLISGIATSFPRPGIERVRTLPSIDEQAEALRAMVDPRDADGILRVAEWLRSKERYERALAEIERVLEFEPEHAHAREMRTLIIQQKFLLERKGLPPEKSAKAPTPKKPVFDFPLLTPEQINLIRVFELDLDASPRLIIPRETVVKLLEKYAGRDGIPLGEEGREVFLRRRPAEIMDTMFRLRARELYAEVKVLDSPPALRLFRENVHRAWLMNSCATTACHGGDHAGRFFLNNRRTMSDATVYTNFLILDRFKLADGTPLINPTEPARSPLLQFALPRGEGHFKHPEVVTGPTHARWRPVFTSRDDSRYKDAIQWIESLFKPRPEYPVLYTPPLPPGSDAAKPTPPTPR